MSEGRSYRCGWSRDENGVRLWTKDAPRVSARGDTWEDAELKLMGAICAATGDGEPVLAFFPPAVLESDLRFLDPPLAAITGCGYSGTKAPKDGYYEGRCAHCGYATGRRTDKIVQLSGIEEQVAQAPGQWSFFCSPVYASERFRALLTQEELAVCEWRPIERPPRSRRVYFEVIPHAFVPQVALRDREVGGWRCPACARRCFSQHGDDDRVPLFVASSALPNPIPPVFGLGDPVYYDLVLARDRALEIAEQPGARGALVNCVGVLADTEIDPHEPGRLYQPDWRHRD